MGRHVELTSQNLSLRQRAPREESFAWILDQQARRSAGLVIEDLVDRMLLPYAPAAAEKVWVEGTGRPLNRSISHDGISYQTFDPPESWSPPYSIYRTTFQHRRYDDFMSHEGEELLIPLAGEITYSFVEWEMDRGVSGPRVMVLPSANPGEWVRIRPSVPHFTTATAASGSATAWMVLRSVGETAGGLGAPNREGLSPEPQDVQRTSQLVTLEELKDPVSYALTAYGLAELIRSARLTSDLTLEQVEKRSGVNAATVNKIEQASPTAPFLATLKVAASLRIDFRRALRRSLSFVHNPLFRDKGVEEKLGPGDLGGFQRLNAKAVRLSRQSESEWECPNFRYASLIALAGEAVIHTTDGSISATHLMSTGQVAHFRWGVKIKGMKLFDKADFLIIYV